MNAAANMLRSVLNTSRAALSSGVPKRPPTSYMLFAKEKRPEIIKKSPELTFGEVGKALGDAWKALSDAQKAKYKK